ncbi:BZ3500_MvSof-1268-A1-R1_Chr7-1g09347 [Microbotryum saponariae]|uniref:BZ3500_MvSof-1268-A1-R1_Chr7-1g09347 protein n=1 Tax=Microbotryum saponariae TaxID=289078 RepID=A0A2X0N7N0_9BASI|nr:BZ3500_MvSof-1268-A1-R1_Chr7-1g09347 [Microbotryum saponariae]
MAATAAHELTIQEKQRDLAERLLFCKELNIVPGPNAGRMLHVHHHHPLYPPTSAMAMKDASRKLKGSETDYRDVVQPDTIRITLSLATHKSLPRVDVEKALIAHYNTAKPKSMCLFSIPNADISKLGSKFDHLLSDICGISPRVIPADPSKGRNHAVHTYDINFRNAEAFARACQRPAFQYRGSPTTITLPHSPVDRVVEIRLRCHSDRDDPDFWLNGIRVALRKSAETHNKTWGTKIATPEILHFQRNLEVVPDEPFQLLFSGDYWCYVQLPEEAMKDVDFNTFLPVHLTNRQGAVVALNNDLQVGFCGYCRRPGHVRSVCPIQQAKTQRQVVGLNRASSKARPTTTPSPATGANGMTLTNAFAGLEEEDMEEEGDEENEENRAEGRGGQKEEMRSGPAEKEEDGSQEEEETEDEQAMEVEQGSSSLSSKPNSNDFGLAAALSTPSITTGALRAMLERAGLLQRPCRHPHPGALPPKYQFVNYYAPVNPKERKAHFSTFSLDREPETTVRIIAGDLNDCPNVMVDRKSVSTEGRSSSAPTYWRTLIGRLPFAVIDTIQYLHPHSNHFSRPHQQAGKIKSWSRIDYILLSEQHAQLLVSGTTYLDALLSDHRPVYVGIACPSAKSTPALPSLPETSSQLLRVNTRVYADEAFAARIPFIIDASRESHPLDPLAAFEEAMSRLRSASSDHARHLNRQFSTTKETLERRIHELEALGTFDDGRRAEWQDLVAMTKVLILDRARQMRIRAHIPELSSEEQLSHTVHARLAARRTAIKIDTLRLADGSPSTDLTKCLDHARAYFQDHHTPDDRDPAQVEAARSTLLDPVRRALPRGKKHSDSRFMRPMTARHAKLLEEPFTADEFAAAIAKTDKGRSPGASGLPYEMYQSSPTVFAELLASTCNEAWTKGALPESMTKGIVRLLKKSKPDADYSDLKYYRPITLRECSYKLMTKVLVARLNKVLPSVLRLSQHGFMPGRKASDAGSHLSLLLEQIRSLDLADSALLSLDQESAYDLVDRDWIMSVFRAMGAPERFLGLLNVIYRSVSLRYIINGYLTEAVRMLCGLGQGDP